MLNKILRNRTIQNYKKCTQQRQCLRACLQATTTSATVAMKASKDGQSNTCCGACYFTPGQKCLFYTAVVLPVAAVVAFAVVLVVNAATLQTKFVRTVFLEKPTMAESPSPDEVIAQAGRLANGIKINTVSYNWTHREEEAFDQIHRYIEETYPSIHSSGLTSAIAWVFLAQSLEVYILSTLRGYIKWIYFGK